ncbi:hypothetical protein XAB3213_960009 [Xanthomonas citri pv. bilvae]|nr:hypothetical protein XAB3213_960009 [Xanthomonas citri pv. bilvae]
MHDRLLLIKKHTACRLSVWLRRVPSPLPLSAGRGGALRFRSCMKAAARNALAPSNVHERHACMIFES